jgi:hypothetical protein
VVVAAGAVAGVSGEQSWIEPSGFRAIRKQ